MLGQKGLELFNDLEGISEEVPFELVEGSGAQKIVNVLPPIDLLETGLDAQGR